jgi:hypothetical protein
MIGANTKRLVLLCPRAISTSLANALHANKARNRSKYTGASTATE